MIKDIILFVSGSSILIGSISWLIQKIITQLLNKDIEKYKYELKEAYIQREITYKNLQEKKFEIIAQVYSLMVDAIYAVEKYCTPFGELKDKIGEKYKESIEKVIEFFKYFDRNRIYLSDELCLIIDNAINELRNTTNDLYNEAQLALHTDNKYDTKALKVWLDSWGKFKNKDNPSVRKELEREIRKLIGVIDK